MRPAGPATGCLTPGRTRNRLPYARPTPDNLRRWLGIDGWNRQFYPYIVWFHGVNEPRYDYDLPEHRRQYGFNNLDFHFGRRVLRLDGRCVAARCLPDHPIARIRTGRFTAEGQLWKVEFRLDKRGPTP